MRPASSWIFVQSHYIPVVYSCPIGYMHIENVRGMIVYFGLPGNENLTITFQYNLP